MNLRRLLIATLALAACGGGEVTVLPPDELPSDIYARPSPASSPSPGRAPRTLAIFFVRGDRLVETTRVQEPSRTRLEDALQALVQGPTQTETGAGLLSAIPPGVQVLEASVDGTIATVNLSREFEAAAEEHLLFLRVAQVVYTATDVSGIDRVRFEVEGEPVDVLARDPEGRNQGVRRDDFPQLAPVTQLQSDPQPGLAPQNVIEP